MVGLPMVTQDLFERVMSHAMSAEEAGERDNASTAHLKADKPRRPARCGTLVGGGCVAPHVLTRTGCAGRQQGTRRVAG